MEQLALWRNIALVVLAIQCVIGVVLALAVTYILVRLMDLAQKKSAVGASKLQQVSRTVAVQSHTYANKVTEPVLKVQGQAARTKQALRSLTPAWGAGAARKRSAPAAGNTTPTP